MSLIIRKYLWFALFVFCFGNLLDQNYNIEDQVLNQLNNGVVDAVNAETKVSVIQSGDKNKLILNQFSYKQLAIIQQAGMNLIIKSGL
ncbi:MAG: hypothetical protein COC06_02140 [Bacteroidales bacterium]|nr:hypothetical protein [Labilibaculum sp.]PCH71207.1 MAG: hypothetical protein COC06_02140 [Bacteroidales bacterium]